MDLEAERKRWEGFFSVWLAEEPETANTKRKAIWKKNKATLWYYPAKQKKYQTPVYLIYSLVNQPFILDLYPGNSLIEAFVSEGFDVYMIDFGIPGFEDKDLTLDDYIVDYIKNGAKRVQEHAKTTQLTVMGFCLGGTIAAVYAALAPNQVRNLILDVAPIDFSGWSIFDQWGKAIQEEGLDFDRIIDCMGLIPPSMMEAGVRLITYPIYYSPYLSLLNRANEPQYVERWRVFNKWTKGHIPLPGGVLKQLFHDYAKENKLVNGKLTVRGKQVDLSAIHGSLLVVASQYDRLVPKETTEKIIHLAGSRDKKYHVSQGGHASFNLQGKLPAYLREWLPQRSN